MRKRRYESLIVILLVLTISLSLHYTHTASAQNGEAVRVLSLSASGFEQAHSVAFSSNGKFLAVGGTSGIYLFDIPNISASNFIH